MNEELAARQKPMNGAAFIRAEPASGNHDYDLQGAPSSCTPQAITTRSTFFLYASGNHDYSLLLQ